MRSLSSIFAFLVLAVILTAAGSCSEPSTTVRIQLIDSETGQPAPAMVSITGPAGNLRLPPQGNILKDPLPGLSEFFIGFLFDPDPNWIGPVRDMRIYQNPLQPSVPYFADPYAYMTSGDFTIDLRDNTWTVSVDHGMEYVPVAQPFVLANDPSPTWVIPMDRWIDPPALGWYSGDVHVHHPVSAQGHRDFLLQWARAVELNVVNALTTWDPNGISPAFHECSGDHCVVPGQEDPRIDIGHVMGVNQQSALLNILPKEFFDVIFSAIHLQPDALVGSAHFRGTSFLPGPDAFPWYVTTGEVDFVETLQTGGFDLQHYIDFLNLGFRLTAAAGSDIPFGSQVGEVRTYVHTGTQTSFDPDLWFQGLADGHTFVTNGPFLELTVDGSIPGDVLAVAAGTLVTVELDLRGQTLVCVPSYLAVESNDGTLYQALNPTAETDIFVSFDHQIDESQWIIAIATCDNGASAHTSPVYVEVNGAPTWNPTLGPAIIQDQLDQLDLLEAAFTPIVDATDQGMHDRVAAARQFYDDLLLQMGP